MVLKASLAALTLLAVSGCPLNNSGPTDGGAPLVQITAPANGATVGGSVSIDALAVDDIGVDKVRFLIDDVELAIVYTAPYHAVWNTSALPNNSQHVITVEASDVAKNTASITATVTVSRGPN
jgi:hypothetical protein